MDEHRLTFRKDHLDKQEILGTEWNLFRESSTSFGAVGREMSVNSLYYCQESSEMQKNGMSELATL